MVWTPLKKDSLLIATSTLSVCSAVPVATSHSLTIQREYHGLDAIWMAFERLQQRALVFLHFGQLTDTRGHLVLKLFAD